MHRTKNLKVGLFNAGSLGTRHDEFLAAMDELSVDIMAINETWLRAGEEGRAPAVPGYRLRHVPRPSAVRGAVGFYVRRGLNARTLAHPASALVEQMWPWITDTVREMMELRNKYYSRWKSSSNEIHMQSYKELKYLVRAALPLACSDPDLLNQHFLDVPGCDFVTISDLTYLEFNRLSTNSFHLQH